MPFPTRLDILPVVLAASVRDLMATKLKVLFDRVEPRDYLDIVELLKHKVSLSQGLADARALFGNPFSPAECMRILCRFDEPELASLIHLIPRRHGDVENPRGGVRHVIPGKGNY